MAKNMQLVRVGSSRGESNFHLIFTPKYRRDVFRDDEVRRTVPGELRSYVLRALDKVGGVRVRAGSRPSIRQQVQELLLPVHVPRFKGRPLTGYGTTCGRGEGQAVGRWFLERWLLLQVGGLHDSGDRSVLRPEQPEEALDAIPRFRDQAQEKEEREAHGFLIRPFGLQAEVVQVDSYKNSSLKDPFP